MHANFSFELLARIIARHRMMCHPFFRNWQRSVPQGELLAAIWYQILRFCAATRPGHNLPKGLRLLDLGDAADRIDAIVASEAGHGDDLATMIAHIMRSASPWYPALTDRREIERALKECSDAVFAHVPGYDPTEGLLEETRAAIAVFDVRKRYDVISIAEAIAAALTLEMASHNHLIPGEVEMVHAYGVSLDAPEMHYLVEHHDGEHGGGGGAEKEHEQHAIAAVVQFIESSHMTEETGLAMKRGAQDFCDRLAALWDVLDAHLPPQTHASS